MQREPVLESRVLSLHAGRPRTLRRRAREYRSAIFKRALTGPQWIGPLGLQGDGQADLAAHGGPHKALCVYSFANLRDLAQEFSRSDFGPGSFGENLCVEDLADECVCIGDVFEIGEARVRVSQPRGPCAKLAMRFDLPELPKSILSSRRCGFYLQVLEPGRSSPGDRMRRLEAHPERLSVAELTRLFHFDRDDRSAVQRALSIDALSPAWRGPLERRFSGR